MKKSIFIFTLLALTITSFSEEKKLLLKKIKNRDKSIRKSRL